MSRPITLFTGQCRPAVRGGVPAAEPETGIITDEALTQAAGTDNSDPAVAGKFLNTNTDNTDNTGGG